MLTSLAALVGSHPRRALFAVVLFVLAAGALGGSVADRLESGPGGFAPADADSIRAVERIERATGREPSPGIVLLVETPDGAAAAGDRIDEVAEQLADRPGIAAVATPQDGAGLVAEDRSAALVVATLTADAEEATVAEGVLDDFADADDVAVGGAAIANTQIRETVTRDLGRAELLAMPLLVLLSLLFFGGRAALLPVIVGATTVLGTFLALTGVNQVYGLSIFALNLVIGLGLGLAIDYTLFLVTRYREELARQGPGLGAIRTTMATAGRTVAYSSLTVAVALVTLTVFPMGFLRSMGIAGALVALVAAASSLVISPALFGLWGAKLARRRQASAAGAGRWYRLSHLVMRRPGAVAVVTALLMLALSVPALRAEWTPVDDTVIPEGQSSRTVADRLADDFAGAGSTPVTIAVEGGSPAEVAAYAAEVNALDGVMAPTRPRDLGGGTWQLDLPVAGDPASAEAQQLVADVRAVDTPLDALVAGPAADFLDQQQAISSSLPLAVALLVALTLLVLWLMTGSVVLPVKAVIMNALTVGVALGALTFVYQDGRLTGLLGYTPNGGIEPTDFLVAAALVFALSTDYGVFLLGRIKEARDAGLGERESVAVGLSRTGSVVTAAAILLAVAIGAFSTSEISFIQQIGVATAVGVLVDAFVVRSLLVPSLMGLLGKWNWWAPMPLRRLHDRFGVSESELAEPMSERPLAASNTP
ncbi:MAG: MMPL family transporter [Actinomycetota bacterium]|nr:MMPL family transporter [Actinomycetota bacterium]